MGFPILISTGCSEQGHTLWWSYRQGGHPGSTSSLILHQHGLHLVALEAMLRQGTAAAQGGCQGGAARGGGGGAACGRGAGGGGGGQAGARGGTPPTTQAAAELRRAFRGQREYQQTRQGTLASAAPPVQVLRDNIEAPLSTWYLNVRLELLLNPSPPYPITPALHPDVVDFVNWTLRNVTPARWPCKISRQC